MPPRSHQTEREALPLPLEFRQAWSELRADYYSGTNTQYRPAPKGVSPMGSGADYHYRNEAAFMRSIERSRHHDRNNMIVGQAITRLVANIWPEEPSLAPETGDSALNADLMQRFYAWADTPDLCDIEQDKDFWTMGELALRQFIVDGDHWGLTTNLQALQMFEAHRVRTPSGTKMNVVHGVLMDDACKRLQVWFTKNDVDPLASVKLVSEMDKKDFRDSNGNLQVLQIYEPLRTSQRRGVSKLSPVVDPINMHDDIQFATLVKAQVASCWTIIEELVSNSPPLPGANNDQNSQTGEQVDETRQDGSTRTVQGIAPGMRVRGKHGVTYKGFAPNIPSPEFFPHAMMILSFIAVNLDLPLQVLLLDPSNTNFSGWRGAIDQARTRYRKLQKLMIQRFYSPVYRWWLRCEIAKDAALRVRSEAIGAKFFAHNWNPPGWPYIQPLQDSADELLQKRNGLTSPRRIMARRGNDYEIIRGEIIEDNAAMIRDAYKKAQELNELFPGLNVTWREVASLPTPDGIQLSLNTNDTASQQNDNAGKQPQPSGGKKSAS